MEIMLKGRMGVFAGSAVTEPPFAAAIAEATGTLVSRRQPAGTHPCLTMSVSTTPEPVGSRCTIHHPLDRESMMKVSPLENRYLMGFGLRVTRTYTTTSNSSSCSAMYG